MPLDLTPELLDLLSNDLCDMAIDLREITKRPGIVNPEYAELRNVADRLMAWANRIDPTATHNTTPAPKET